MSKKVKIGGFKAQIWNACDDNQHRPVLNYAHVTNGFIYATNGHILVKQCLNKVHELDDEQVVSLEGKYLHKDLLKMLHKQDVVLFKADGIHISSVGIDASVVPYSQCDIRFPNAEAVIPNGESKQSVDHIGVDMSKLTALIKSMSFSALTQYRLTFYGESRAILVRGNEFDRESEIGLIMPVNTQSW